MRNIFRLKAPTQPTNDVSDNHKYNFSPRNILRIVAVSSNLYKMSSSEDNDNAAAEEEHDHERLAIRSQLSTLSFEELQKLKERVGAKVYKEALFGTKEKKNEKIVFKRENKNRPREMSAKKPVPMVPRLPSTKSKEIRDPRFDPLCGVFDKKEFTDNYNFLSEVRMKDIKAIRSELKETTDPDKQVKLRRLLQRLNDQHKEARKSKVEKEQRQIEKKHIVQEYKEGRQPHFRNKSEMKVEALVKQYEDLKKEGSGRVQRHLKRRQQKVKKKSFKAPTGPE